MRINNLISSFLDTSSLLSGPVKMFTFTKPLNYRYIFKSYVATFAPVSPTPGNPLDPGGPGIPRWVLKGEGATCQCRVQEGSRRVDRERKRKAEGKEGRRKEERREG